MFRLVEVTEKLKSTLAEVEALRISNSELKEQLMQMREEMESKNAALNMTLEVGICSNLVFAGPQLPSCPSGTF